MNADVVFSVELHRLRTRRPEVTGAVLATVDGLLVASDLPGSDAQHLAALAAAGLGLGHRFTQTVGHGHLWHSVVWGSTGCVITYPAGEQGLLAVLAQPRVDLPTLHADAGGMAHRLGTLVTTGWPPVELVPEPPPFADPHAPLAVRTPMASLPADLRDDPRRHPRIRH